MAKISFEVSRNGNVIQLQENVDESNSIGDLIKSLKAIKQSSNDTLTKLLQEETSKNVRKADEKDNDTDDADEEQNKEESRKKLKS